MSDTHLVHVEELDESTRRSAAEALAMVAEALQGCTIPVCDIRAAGPQASPAEGLALLASFTAIKDPRLRQALLDATAALAHGTKK